MQIRERNLGYTHEKKKKLYSLGQESTRKEKGYVITVTHSQHTFLVLTINIYHCTLF